MRRGLLVVALVLLLIGSESLAADFDGDGTGDIAIFRPSSGLWAIRGISRVYFGGAGDNPAPGDFDGSGTDSITIFRASSGLWAVRNNTRVYFGASNDQNKSGDYNGDGTEDFGIFRESSGLWAVRGITRLYYGTSQDMAIAPGKVRVSRGLPSTGQTICREFGDDGFYEAGAPFRYVKIMYFPSGDCVVTDKNTRLMWASDGYEEGCNWGQTTDWNSAIWFCNTLEFAGFTDWRLPNVKELASIVDYSQLDPSIDTEYFTCYTFNPFYWSSTSYFLEERAYGVDFWAGEISYVNKTSELCVRAVRGGL